MLKKIGEYISCINIDNLFNIWDVQNIITINHDCFFSDKWERVPGAYNDETLIYSVSNFINKNNLCSFTNKIRFKERINNNYNMYLFPVEYVYYNGFHINIKFQEKTLTKNIVKSIVLTIKSKKSIKEIKEFLETCYKEYKEDMKIKDYKTYIYKQLNDEIDLNFNRYELKNDITFDDLFIPNKEKIINLAEKFRKGEIKKLSYLLYGEPGCGKSSIIKALANYLGFHIIEVKLSYIYSSEQLTKLFHDEYIKYDKLYNDIIPLKNRIYIFEDVDAESNLIYKRSNKVNIKEKKNNKYNKYNLTLSDILNCLDGVMELQSVIVFTTNFLEKLDKAFVRPGRITYRIELKKINKEQANLMTIKKFGKPINIQDYLITPASLASLCEIAENINELHTLISDWCKIEEQETKNKIELFK